MSSDSISLPIAGENHHLIFSTIANQLVSNRFNHHNFPRTKVISECVWRFRFEFDDYALSVVNRLNKTGLQNILI